MNIRQYTLRIVTPIVIVTCLAAWLVETTTSDAAQRASRSKRARKTDRKRASNRSTTGIRKQIAATGKQNSAKKAKKKPRFQKVIAARRRPRADEIARFLNPNIKVAKAAASSAKTAFTLTPRRLYIRGKGGVNFSSTTTVQTTQEHATGSTPYKPVVVCGYSRVLFRTRPGERYLIDLHIRVVQGGTLSIGDISGGAPELSYKIAAGEHHLLFAMDAPDNGRKGKFGAWFKKEGSGSRSFSFYSCQIEKLQ